MLLGTSHPDALAKLQALENFAPAQREEIETKYGKPVFTIPLQGNIEIQEGEPVRLHCQLIPVGDPTLKVLAGLALLHFYTVTNHRLFIILINRLHKKLHE